MAAAVTTATRSPVLPDIPTVAEFVPGYEFSFWYGIGAPRNTPAEIVDKLNHQPAIAGQSRFMSTRPSSAWTRPSAMKAGTGRNNAKRGLRHGGST